MTKFCTKTGALALVLAGMTGMAAQGETSRLDRMFGLVDADRDGALSRAELDGFAERRFARTDRNSDGMLSQDEVREAAAARAREASSRRFTQMDANGDGQVARDEFLTARETRAGRMFERLDADRDGRITREEIAAKGRQPRPAD